MAGVRHIASFRFHFTSIVLVLVLVPLQVLVLLPVLVVLLVLVGVLVLVLVLLQVLVLALARANSSAQYVPAPLIVLVQQNGDLVMRHCGLVFLARARAVGGSRERVAKVAWRCSSFLLQRQQ